MLSDIEPATVLRNTSLDNYLERGWFRIGQSVFTTNFLHFDGIVYSALWLKVVLEEFKLTASQKKIIHKNKQFEVKYCEYSYSLEKENLYKNYRDSLNFNTSESLNFLLADDGSGNEFNTYEVGVYDEGKLIALGVFDIGNETAEGIVSIFDPNYKKYSLGKFLVLKKIEFLILKDIKIFYPGYYVPGYKQFDYKLDISKNATYFLDIVSKSWKHFDLFDLENTPINTIKSKISELSILLNTYGLTHQTLIYDYFDINMTENFNGYGLLDIPIFIYCYTNKINQEAIFIYDFENSKYKFITCSKDFSITFPNIRDGHYYSFLLKEQKTLVEAENANELLEIILDKVV